MSSIFCAAMGVAEMHALYVNRRVLGNIEATNATRGHIHTDIPRDVGRCHDQCGARSGSPQLYLSMKNSTTVLMPRGNIS